MSIIQWESAAELRRQGRAGRRQKQIDTPWGISQSVETLATGIESVTTASHGGIFVDAEHVAEMPELIRVGMPATGGMWFEEDELWVFPFLFFYRELRGHSRITPAWLESAGKMAGTIRWIAGEEGLCERMGWDISWKLNQYALADWIDHTLAEIACA